MKDFGMLVVFVLFFYIMKRYFSDDKRSIERSAEEKISYYRNFQTQNSNVKHGASYGAESLSDPLPSRVSEAINQNQDIIFDYTNKKGVSSRRRVSPKKIYSEYGYVFLEGYCWKRHSLRTFYIMRMSNLEITRKTG